MGPISPTVLNGRGSAVSCSSANLPAGLSVDPTTCKISGTPTAEFYGSPTITAVNSVDKTTATLSISIIPGVPVLKYSGSLIGTVGTFVSITPSLDIKGGALKECKSSTALPLGLSIDGTNCQVKGTPQVAIKGTYTITAKNDGGSGVATLYIGIEAPAYDCIANGYTGPSGTVTSVSSCYLDCDLKKLCGGKTNDKNGCYEKTSVKTGTQTCGNYAVVWETKTCKRCAESTKEYYGSPTYDGYHSFYSCTTLPCNASSTPPWYAKNCASDIMASVNRYSEDYRYLESCSGPEYVGGNQFRCACVFKTHYPSVCLRDENYDCSGWKYEYQCHDDYELTCL